VHIFCRYLCPGECIVHDRGSEFCNHIVENLTKDFGVEMRVISAGRPMANGQAESAVKNVKNKLKLLCIENRNYYFFSLQFFISRSIVLIINEIMNSQEIGMVFFSKMLYKFCDVIQVMRPGFHQQN